MAEKIALGRPKADRGAGILGIGARGERPRIKENRLIEQKTARREV